MGKTANRDGLDLDHDKISNPDPYIACCDLDVVVQRGAVHSICTFVQ